MYALVRSCVYIETTKITTESMKSLESDIMLWTTRWWMQSPSWLEQFFFHCIYSFTICYSGCLNFKSQKLIDTMILLLWHILWRIARFISKQNLIFDMRIIFLQTIYIFDIHLLINTWRFYLNFHFTNCALIWRNIFPFPFLSFLFNRLLRLWQKRWSTQWIEVSAAGWKNCVGVD